MTSQSHCQTLACAWRYRRTRELHSALSHLVDSHSNGPVDWKYLARSQDDSKELSLQKFNCLYKWYSACI